MSQNPSHNQRIETWWARQEVRRPAGEGAPVDGGAPSPPDDSAHMDWRNWTTRSFGMPPRPCSQASDSKPNISGKVRVFGLVPCRGLPRRTTALTTAGPDGRDNQDGINAVAYAEKQRHAHRWCRRGPSVCRRRDDRRPVRMARSHVDQAPVLPTQATRCRRVRHAIDDGWDTVRLRRVAPIGRAVRFARKRGVGGASPGSNASRAISLPPRRRATPGSRRPSHRAVAHLRR